MKQAYQLISKQTLLQAICLIVLGVSLLFNPTTVFEFSVIVISIYLVINGCLMIFSSVQAKKANQDYYTNFIFGLINIVLAIFLYFFAGKLILLLPVLLGLFILYNSIVNLIQGVQIQKQSSHKAGGYIVYSTIILIIGLILIFYPFKITILLFRVVGVILLVMGIVSAMGSRLISKEEKED